MNDFNPIDLLLGFVDALTIDVESTVWQDFDEGRGRRATTVVTPALIGQLRESFASSTSGNGGGSLPNQRNIIDGDALEKYERLTAQILSAYKSVTSAAPFTTPEQNLRQWFIAVSNDYRAGKISDDALLKKVQRWADWVRIIEDKLWPPTTLEIIAPCPVCDNRWAKSDDGNSVTAIVIEYRKPENERINALAKSHAKCRACKTVWRGDTKLRELAWHIDYKQHAETPETVDSMSVASVTLLGAGNSCAQNDVGA